MKNNVTTNKHAGMLRALFVAALVLLFAAAGVGAVSADAAGSMDGASFLQTAQNGVITLTDDVVLSSTATVSKDTLVINLGGHTLTSVDGTLLPDGTIKITGSAAVTINGPGLVTGGTRTDPPSYNNEPKTIYMEGSSELTVNSATVNGSKGINTKYAGHAIESSSTGKITIQNAEINGGECEKKGVTLETRETFNYKYQGYGGRALKVNKGSSVSISTSKIHGGYGSATEDTSIAYVDGGTNQAYGGVAISLSSAANLTLVDSTVIGGNSDVYNAEEAISAGSCDVSIQNSTVTGGSCLLNSPSYGIAGAGISAGAAHITISEHSKIAGGGFGNSWVGAGIELSNWDGVYLVVTDSEIRGGSPGSKSGNGYGNAIYPGSWWEPIKHDITLGNVIISAEGVSYGLVANEDSSSYHTPIKVSGPLTVDKKSGKMLKLADLTIDAADADDFVLKTPALIEDADSVNFNIPEGYCLSVPTAKTGEYYEYTLVKAVAKIGDEMYFTLADAVEAAQKDETIDLLKSFVSSGISVASEKEFTVDFNGYTVTFDKPGAGSTGTKTIGFQLLKDSVITLKNGSINASAGNKDATWTSDSTVKGIAMFIQNYCDLTLEDMVIDGTNIAHNGAADRYVISNNCGNVNLTGSTSIITAENDYAFDSCKYGNYGAPVVNVSITGEITGKIELSGGKLNIENGCFKGEITTDTGYTSGDAQISGGIFSVKPADEYIADGYSALKSGDVWIVAKDLPVKGPAVVTEGVDALYSFDESLKIEGAAYLWKVDEAEFSGDSSTSFKYTFASTGDKIITVSAMKGDILVGYGKTTVTVVEQKKLPSEETAKKISGNNVSPTSYNPVNLLDVVVTYKDQENANTGEQSGGYESAEHKIENVTMTSLIFEDGDAKKIKSTTDPTSYAIKVVITDHTKGDKRENYNNTVANSDVKAVLNVTVYNVTQNGNKLESEVVHNGLEKMAVMGFSFTLNKKLTDKEKLVAYRFNDDGKYQPLEMVYGFNASASTEDKFVYDCTISTPGFSDVVLAVESQRSDGTASYAVTLPYPLNPDERTVSILPGEDLVIPVNLTLKNADESTGAAITGWEINVDVVNTSGSVGKDTCRYTWAFNNSIDNNIMTSINGKDTRIFDVIGATTVKAEVSYDNLFIVTVGNTANLVAGGEYTAEVTIKAFQNIKGDENTKKYTPVTLKVPFILTDRVLAEGSNIYATKDLNIRTDKFGNGLWSTFNESIVTIITMPVSFTTNIDWPVVQRNETSADKIADSQWKVVVKKTNVPFDPAKPENKNYEWVVTADSTVTNVSGKVAINVADVDKDAKALMIEFRGLKVGDVVENNNEVNLYDIDMILQEAVHSGDVYSADDSYIVEKRRVYADANHDGKVSTADAILIFNYYMEYTETQNMLYSLYLIK